MKQKKKKKKESKKLEETAGISKSELEAKETEIAKLQEELANKEKESPK